MEIIKTILHQKHCDLGAKMAPFAGYDMPIQYTSVKDESLAVRNSCGVFDVSHMGEFFVKGPDSVKFVDFIVTNDFANAGNLKAVYSPLCREDGTVIDDLIAYKLKDDEVLICVNASNIEKDWNWISSKTEGFDITLENQSDKTSLLALQGPNSEKILKELNLIPRDDFTYYSVGFSKFEDSKVLIARTGYTGEDGFEIFCPNESVTLLWDKLLDLGVTPCGLASRDVLRLEVCYPLYGHELNDQLTPLDANLKWTVKESKPEFIGKEKLAGHSSKYRLAKLSLDKGIPREGYSVLNQDGKTIGYITSGTHSVVLGKGICLAHIERDSWPASKEFSIEIRNRVFPATYHTKPFVTGGHK
jgi:aminomethyltransferase